MTAIFGLVCSAVIGVIVSLFTKPKPEAELAGLWIGSIDIGRRKFKGAEPNYEVGKKITAELRVSPDGTSGPTTALSVAELQATAAKLAEARDAPVVDLRYASARAPVSPPPPGQAQPEYSIVRLGTADMQRLKAREGDLLFVGNARWWLGGLRSLHCRAGTPHDEGKVVLMAQEAFKAGNFLPGRRVRVEKFF